MLRDTFNGDTALLQNLIEDRTVSEWSRAMAVYSLGMLYFDGHINRETITGFIRRLIYEDDYDYFDDEDDYNDD